MRPVPNIMAAALGLALLAPGDPATAQPTSFAISTPGSSLVVDVHKRGALSPFLHDHHLRFSQVHSAFVFDPQRPEATRGELVVEAGVFADEQAELSQEDRRKVEATVRGTETLDTARYPTIRFTFSGLEVLQRGGDAASGTVRGTLVGTLHIRDRSAPIRVPMAATHRGSGVHVTGATAFRQSTFGIKPYSTALGTVGVEDRVDVHFDVIAQAAR